jgi:phage terminase Nu1 subunit (DNA packaging protein)
MSSGVIGRLAEAVQGIVMETVTNLINREQLAKKLRVSVRTVDRLLAEGCPHLRIRNAIRFIFLEVLTWIAQRSKGLIQQQQRRHIG